MTTTTMRRTTRTLQLLILFGGLGVIAGLSLIRSPREVKPELGSSPRLPFPSEAVFTDEEYVHLASVRRGVLLVSNIRLEFTATKDLTLTEVVEEDGPRFAALPEAAAREALENCVENRDYRLRLGAALVLPYCEFLTPEELLQYLAALRVDSVADVRRATVWSSHLAYQRGLISSQERTAVVRMGAGAQR